MTSKYNNPRLFNTVLTGPGMTHPRNPHVVIGSDTKGFVLGDLMDANAIMETIDQKIDVDNLIDEEKLTTAVQTAVDSILGDVSESLDTLKEVEDKFEEVEGNIPTKLSLLENFTGAAPEIGNYLYEDFTWGSDSTGAIGICVGTPDMFPDGKARFCELLISSSLYKWSENQSDSPLPNLINGWADILSDTYNGYINTDTLINSETDTYPASIYTKTKFDGKGYLPTARELLNCAENIKSLVNTGNKRMWTSTECDSQTALCFKIDPTQYQTGTAIKNAPVAYNNYCIAFCALDVPPTYITTTDLATEEKAGLMSSELCAVLNDIYHDRDDVLAIGTNTFVDGSLVVQDGMTLYGSGMTVEGDTDTVTLTGEDFVQLKQLISNG